MKILLAAVMAAFFVPAAAIAQTAPCYPSDEFRAAIAGPLGFKLIASGLQPNGVLVEWWGDVESGKWVVSITTPNGMTCLGAGGGAFQRIVLKPNV